MLCDIQRIINEIQNSSRAISLQASTNHTQTIGKSQEILNEILKLDFECDNGLNVTLPILKGIEVNVNNAISLTNQINSNVNNTLNLTNQINSNVNNTLNLTNQINPKIDIVNTNVIDVKSTVITANQNILSIKNDLSLVSQRIISLISSVSQISTAINSLTFSISSIQSTVNNSSSSIFNINALLANIQSNLNLILNTTNTTSVNVSLILNLASTINNNTENILECCEEIKDLLEEEPPIPSEFDFIDIICIDCTDPEGPDCPPDATPEEKERGYREREITLDSPMEALQLVNSQVALLQKKFCPADEDDCMVLLPDPSLPLTTRGHYLLFSWVLEENPKVSVYQNHTQLRNPIDALRVAGNHWNQYFEPIYRILGQQYGTYFSDQNSREPLVKGWFLNIPEGERFFNQMKALTKDTPRNEGNPRFAIVGNDSVPIVNAGKKIILKKVCYGFYNEGKFIKVHSWHRPKNG
jgi:hypothetical protein